MARSSSTACRPIWSGAACLARLGPVRLGEACGPSSWTDAALRESGHLIVVCSPLSPRSARMDEEIARFRALGRAERIRALLVDGEPRTALPPALLELAPPVTDIRPAPGQDHRHMLRAALLELVAGVLGLDHAVLRRSDEARAASRLRWATVASLVAALLCLGLALLAGIGWRRAEEELRATHARRLAAEAQAALAQTPFSPGMAAPRSALAALLALKSLGTEALPEGDAALRRALWRLADPPLEAHVAEGELLVALAPAGRSLLVAGKGEDAGSRTVRRYQVASGEWMEDGVMPAPTPRSRASPYETAGPGSGEEVLTESEDGTLQLLVDDRPPDGDAWALASYRVVRAADQRTLWRLPHDWRLRFAAFSPDGGYLVTVTSEVGEASAGADVRLPGSTIRVFDLAHRRLLTEVSLAQQGIAALALSPDRSWLATESRTTDGLLVRLWPLWPDTLRAEACRRLPRDLCPRNGRRSSARRTSTPSAPAGLPAAGRSPGTVPA